MDFAVTQLDSSDWQRGRAVRLRALAKSPAAFGSVLGVEQRLDDSVWPQRVTPVEAATFVAVSDSGEDVGLIVGAPDDDDAGLFSMGGCLCSPAIRGRRETGRGDHRVGNGIRTSPNPPRGRRRKRRCDRALRQLRIRTHWQIRVPASSPRSHHRTPTSVGAESSEYGPLI